jgi:hypothetical protein
VLFRDRALGPVITPLTCQLEAGKEGEASRTALDKGVPDFERAFPARTYFRFQLINERQIADVDIRHGVSDDQL